VVGNDSKEPNLIDNVGVLPVEGNTTGVKPGNLEEGDEIMVRLRGPFVNNLPDSMREGQSQDSPISVPMGVTVRGVQREDNGRVKLGLSLDENHILAVSSDPDQTIKQRLSPETESVSGVSPWIVIFGVILLVEVIVVLWLIV